MRTAVVLVMHGVPPRDFPRREIAELMALRNRLEHGAVPPHERTIAEARFAELDAKVRGWPRHAENDAFYMASQQLAIELARATGIEVQVGFNEFCAPTVPAALEQAVATGAQKVVVITPMLTPGGEHSEVEIPAQVEEARHRHPGVAFVYAWPYAMSDVAAFLAQRIAALG
ncbi:MAG: sirohydrochlorin chelatase [Nitrososphaerales archaeon]